MIESDPLRESVTRACAGDVSAVDEVVSAVQDQIYGLAVRMLWHPEDAKDVTQDILVKIITNLARFRGQSRFSSWCFAIAANHLRTVRRSRVEQVGYTFETFEAELHDPAGTEEQAATDPEYAVAVEEVRVGCTLGMLMCLSHDERLAYIIGEILEFDHNEAAEILEVTPAAFRQRLSRARKAIMSFTGRVCGVVDGANACSCTHRASYAIQRRRVQLGAPLFAGLQAGRHEEIKSEIQRLDTLRRAVALYRAQPDFRAPEQIREVIVQSLHGPARKRDEPAPM